jgi:aldehyde:ferredoxin oxidoreductase
VTGWDVTTDDLVFIGERIENMRQAFNLREGIDLTQFKIAGRMLGKPPFKAGPNAGITVDEKTMIQDYFKVMQWNPETGKPNKKRMAELGLGDVAEELGL